MGTSFSCSTQGRIGRRSSSVTALSPRKYASALAKWITVRNARTETPVSVCVQMWTFLSSGQSSLQTLASFLPARWSVSLVLYSNRSEARRQKSSWPAKKPRASRTSGHRHRADLGRRPVELLFGEDDVGRHELLGSLARLDPLDELVEEARVEGAADDDVDAVPQRLDDLVGAAALVVVGGEEPGGAGHSYDLVEHLGVVVAP